ncbi:xanthine dehydrogenase/oxidase [Pelomyxa schiedti]|nr:xanthine dehydrogenase/oxidase [Pelomyxa schiedti]
MASTTQAATFSFVQETLLFYLNGKRVELLASEIDPNQTLAEFVRGRGLSGTKIGCSEGGCGACTVMISSWVPETNAVEHRSVAACLLPLAYVDHMLVTTVEGIAPAIGMHPIQQHIAAKHGTQCGYCTPGVVMSVYSTAMRNPSLSMSDVEQCLDGNLCRCTGYRSILEAARSIAVDYTPSSDGKLSKAAAVTPVCARTFVQNAVTFPDELRQPLRPLRLIGKSAAWYRPVALSELLDLKCAVPNAEVVAGKHSFPEHALEKPQVISGNTEIGYQARYHPRPPGSYQSFVSTTAIPELKAVKWTEQGVSVGAGTTINGLIKTLKNPSPSIGTPNVHQQEGFSAICHLLQYFANNQVRDMGTIGGSLVTCDPLSDLYPALIAMNSVVRLASKAGQRELLLDDFVLGENKTALKPDEVVMSVFIPFSQENEFVETFKESKRRVDAQAMVNGGFRARLQQREGKWCVEKCVLAVGALGSRAGLRMKSTESFLEGKEISLETLSSTSAVMQEELKASVVHSRGAAAYRVSVACSMLCRFFASIAAKKGITDVAERLHSALPDYSHPVHTGTQDYADPSPGSSVGSPVPHMAAEKHAKGTAEFVADIPIPQGCLYAAYTLSKRAHARILRIDKSTALAVPGVVAVIDASDIPGINLLGSIATDEEVLASKEVVFYAQPVAIVVAESHHAAHTAALQVNVTYEDLASIQTIEEAVASNSFLCEEKLLEKGNANDVFKSWPADQIVSGTIRSGGQEHFYIEPQAALVVPSSGNYLVRVTSQNPSKMQRAVASVLGIPANRVESRMERIGGGFGGKQDRPQFLAAACALASHITERPVKMVLERDQDMQITGQRHEFKTDYKVAYSRDGTIEAVSLEMYSNGGCSLDLSPAVMEVAMFAFDCCYRFPAIRITGKCCRTHRVSCTAYRGFGKPQAMVVTEGVIDRVARACGIAVQNVRDANVLRMGDKLTDGTPVEEQFFACWEPLRQKFAQKQKEVLQFNSENIYRKRGVSLVPSRNNIGFEADCLNQGGCIVNVYLDGTVFVSHGGSEMGQGLSTKVAQVTADALHIPLSLVFVGATATDRVPNTTATAASTGTDLNAGAALDAATKLRARLDAVADEAGIDRADWNKVVSEAYGRRVWLSEIGHTVFEKFAYDWHTKVGRSTLYHIWGAALAVVELDVLTGHSRTLSVDVIQDLGRSVNPAIDVGQVEGGIMQGIGLYTLEEFSWAKDGHLRTRNVSTYKIPTHDDTPTEMNVSLLKSSRSALGVHGQKSPSEVGVQLSACVLSAIKDAVYASCPSNTTHIQIDTPATCEKIRAACPSHF